MRAYRQSTILDLIFFGVVAKWQGMGLQNPYHGFESRRRLLKKIPPFGGIFLCNLIFSLSH